MQSINKKIINPVFFIIFFGPAILLTHQAISFNLNSITAAASYVFGTIGVTIVKNVPMNNKIENSDLNKLSDNEKIELRRWYEPAWNKWHYNRTLFSVLAFILTATK